MDFLQRDLNIISHDKEKTQAAKRKAALDRVAKLVNDSSLDNEALITILRTCVRSLEDSSEACRAAAVELLDKLLPRLGDDGPDWLFPVLMARMTATGDQAEPSEEQRLDVFNLAMNTMRKYRHEVGPRGFLATISEIIAAGIKDKFPDLLKAACKACVELCETEPKGVKHFALPLAKLVKLHGLQHKHSSTRVEAVKAFAILIKHGAQEMLADTKDEMDNRTTVFYISILAHDHTESVRRTTLEMLSTLLLDITDRIEQHRRLVPILLAMTSDPSGEIRDQALATFDMIGKLYKIDHEDNRIDMRNRRVTVKDIEWYADDEYPDMRMHFKTQFNLPDLGRRPDLGSRLVVAECVRHFLEKILADLVAVDWLIPFSTVSRRIVALRVLNALIWYCESNVVQHAEPILGSLFKTLLHEDAPIRKESQFSVELLGKFLKPQFYLPILLRRDTNAGAVNQDAAIAPSKNLDEEKADSTSTTVVRKGSAVVTTTVMDADANPSAAPLPTLFQTAASTTKRGILIALRCLLLGTGKTLEPPHAKQLVQALTDPDILDLDAPLLVLAVCEAIEGLVDALILREFIATPNKPLPEEVRNRPDQRTLDSMLFVVLLTSLSCPEKQAVVPAVRQIIDRCSEKITGAKRGWFDLHCLRILHRHTSTLTPEAFAELMEKTADLSPLGEVLTNLFVGRLSNVNYSLRVVNELKLLGEMRRVLSAHVESASVTQDGAAAAASSDSSNRPQPVNFSAAQLELLIRSVILYHLRFVPGGTSHLFRKEALHCLREILKPARRAVLKKEAFEKPWEESNDPRVNPTPLSEKIVSAWLSMVDNDDQECRLTCIEMLYDVCMMPLSPGLASETLVQVLNRLDDNLDPLRLQLVQQLHRVLTSPDDDVSPAFVNEVKAQLATMTRKLLLHLDDHREVVGIKGAIRDVLKRMCGINCQLVHQMTREVRSKHSTTQYIDEILAFSPSS